MFLDEIFREGVLHLHYVLHIGRVPRVVAHQLFILEVFLNFSPNFTSDLVLITFLCGHAVYDFGGHLLDFSRDSNQPIIEHLDKRIPFPNSF